MAQYKRKNIENNAIGADQIALDNNEYLKAENAAGNGFINILRVKADDTIEIPFYETIVNVDSKDADTLSSANTYTDDAIAAIPPVDLTGYATEQYVDDAIAAIPPVDLTGYATEQYVDDAIAAIVPVDLTQIESDISQLQLDVTALDGRVDTLEGLVTNVQNHTGNLNASAFKIYILTGTSTVRLPNPVLGRTVTIKKTGSDLVTLEPHNTEKIEGVAANYLLTSTLQSATLVSNGTNWFII